MDVIVNADFKSIISSDSVEYHNVRWSQVILGQNQKADGTIKNDSSLDGRISGVNIWQNRLNEANTKYWYNSGLENQYYKPDIIGWPEFGSLDKRFGDVHFVKVASGGSSSDFTFLFDVCNITLISSKRGGMAEGRRPDLL